MGVLTVLLMINMKSLILSLALVAAVSASLKDPSYKEILKSKYVEASTKTQAKLGEDWTGEGSIKCYGQMNILASRPFVDVTGTAECRPRRAPANPQGFILMVLMVPIGWWLMTKELRTVLEPSPIPMETWDWVTVPMLMPSPWPRCLKKSLLIPELLADTSLVMDLL